MASIYETNDWMYGSAHLPYLKHYVVLRTTHVYSGLTGDDNFYYSLQDILSAGDNKDPVHATEGPTRWGGMITYGVKLIPHFFWVPNYSAGVESQPKVDVVKFGDGYEQRTTHGISNALIKLDLTFDNRSEQEATAIAHFLHARGATEAFAFLPPSPYASMKKFICRGWSLSMNFQDNYSIKGNFEEVIE